MILVRDGKTYAIDPTAKTVKEMVAQQPLVHSEANGAGAAPLFAKNCAACHGPDGRGIAAIGTPNFTDSAFQRSRGPG